MSLARDAEIHPILASPNVVPLHGSWSDNFRQTTEHFLRSSRTILHLADCQMGLTRGACGLAMEFVVQNIE